MVKSRSFNGCCPIVLFAALISLGSCDAGVFVESSGERPAMGAVSDASCGVLLSVEWPDASAADLVQYREAVEKGNIVPLESGTKVKDEKGVFFEGGRFIPPYSVTENEMKARKISFAQWLVPKEGKYAGKRLCVSMSVIRASHPPL